MILTKLTKNSYVNINLQDNHDWEPKTIKQTYQQVKTFSNDLNQYKNDHNTKNDHPNY